MVMTSLRLAVRATAWMVGEIMPWQLFRSRDLDARITRAQAAFDAFEEEHEAFPGEPDGLDWMLSWPPNTASVAAAAGADDPTSPQVGCGGEVSAPNPPSVAPSPPPSTSQK